LSMNEAYLSCRAKRNRPQDGPTQSKHPHPRLSLQAGLEFLSECLDGYATSSKAGTETRYKALATHYFFFPRTFVPIRNNFLTVPVGRLFI
jgi:hypothetical protein